MSYVQGVVSDVSVEQEIQINKARPLSSRSTRNLVRQSEFSFVINMSKSQQPNTAKVNFQFISQPSVDQCVCGQVGRWGSRGGRGPMQWLRNSVSFYLAAPSASTCGLKNCHKRGKRKIGWGRLFKGHTAKPPSSVHHRVPWKPWGSRVENNIFLFGREEMDWYGI